MCAFMNTHGHKFLVVKCVRANAVHDFALFMLCTREIIQTFAREFTHSYIFGRLLLWTLATVIMAKSFTVILKITVKIHKIACIKLLAFEKKKTFFII